MTDLTKTLAFVAVAIGLTGAAFMTVPDRSAADAAFDDQGQPFFPAFEDPTSATAMEVIDYNPDTASALPFKVSREDGRWVIPSHHDYPADAKDRLARTAAGVIGLKKDTIRSDRVEDHEAMGVVDPLDTKSTSLKGRGKRVTLKDPSGKVLADFIIGNEVRDQPDQRYVRVPGQNRVYGVNVKVDLSTRFADWIETNLLQIDAGRVRKIVVDNYKVDPEAGTIRRGDVVTLTRKSATDPWTIEGEVPAGQELDSDKIRTLTTALGDLKIVGVRPKPEGLTRDLQATGPEGFQLTPQSQRSLIARGFYPYQGRLLSNQGDVIVTTDEGVEYTLRYGEVVFASGDELTAGSAEEEETGSEAAAPKKPEGAQENRYLFVTAAFKPDLIPEPEPVKPEVAEGELPENVFHRDPDDPAVVAEEKAKKDEEERKKAERERLVAEGQKRAQSLSDRFAAWYYVTPGESFRSIVLGREALIRPETPAGAGTPPPGQGFNLPSPHGLPPGL